LLKNVLQQTNSISAIHALWILDEFAALDDTLLRQATHTREHMVRIAERRGFVPDVGADPRLDLQVMLSLGVIGESNRLAQLATKYSGSRWHELALACNNTNVLVPVPRPQTNRLAVTSDRKAVIRHFESALNLKGDAVKGRLLFEARCAMCHPLDKTRVSVGPDLAGIATRPKEALLVDILDPSAQVAPDFAAYTVSLKDGESISGLIVAENETRVTLRRPNEPDAVLTRSRIAQIRPEGKSLMPEGLEEGMTLQDMADLLWLLTR
jgi:putative heme-binding domain-containing protein